jgi:hypothetical protein
MKSGSLYFLEPSGSVPGLYMDCFTFTATTNTTTTTTTTRAIIIIIIIRS